MQKRKREFLNLYQEIGDGKKIIQNKYVIKTYSFLAVANGYSEVLPNESLSFKMTFSFFRKKNRR